MSFNVCFLTNWREVYICLFLALPTQTLNYMFFQLLYSNISLYKFFSLINKFFNLINTPTYRPTQLSLLLLLINCNYMIYHFNHFFSNSLNINRFLSHLILSNCHNNVSSQIQIFSLLHLTNFRFLEKNYTIMSTGYI